MWSASKDHPSPPSFTLTFTSTPTLPFFYPDGPTTPLPSPPTFSNWSGTRTRTPGKVVTATCLADIQAAVCDARAAGQRVRAVARAHTWSDVFVDDGDVLLDVSRLKAVTAFDAAARTVTVQAGVTTADLIPL
eukprot:contig_38659_g9022